jgi:hypothetical protein
MQTLSPLTGSRSPSGICEPQNIPPHSRRITICAWHHLRGIHAGGVRATGEAPADITWELGVRAGRRPLLRLHGDRYVR